MVLLAIVIEKLVLKHLVNQPPIILFMATIGMAYFLEGLGDLMWGADIKKLDVGLPQGISETIESVTDSVLWAMASSSTISISSRRWWRHFWSCR